MPKFHSDFAKRKWQRENTPKGQKWCTSCKEWHLEADFTARRDARDGLCYFCRSCARKKEQEKRLKNPEASFRAMKARHLADTYGITQEQYDVLCEQQGGVCAICGQPEKRTVKGTLCTLCVDHDHETSAVRSLLCARCNSGLGQFQDNTRLLLAAVEYLRKHGRR